MLADALLNSAKDLKPNELVAVAEVKKALEAPEQDESKSLLGKVWSATTDITGFASNVAQIHQWGEQNVGLIAAAWAAGATLL